MAITSPMPARTVKGNVKAQDKILYVANKLGLSSLKYMQGTTRVVYDQDVDATTNTATLFENAQQRAFPISNVGATGNQFQVNECLLVEKIGFFQASADDGENYGSATDIGVKFDLIIGNKTVMKDVCIEAHGQQAFYVDGSAQSHVLDLEGVGILIPPQVEYKVVAKTYNTTTREAVNSRIGIYLFGTGVLLDFNTSI
jgi:hypothetical protein